MNPQQPPSPQDAPSSPGSAEYELIARTKAALDDDAGQLDYRSQLKLQQARAAALSALAAPDKTRRRSPLPLLWLTAVPAALAIVLAVPLLLPTSVPNNGSLAANDMAPNENLQSFDDLALLADEADLDTLADIEFYQWLAENPDASEA